MLLSADQPLVDRDPALPGLARLLDTDALNRWLSHQLDDAVRIRPRYLRYKAGTSCVLAADLETAIGTQPCLVTAYSAMNAGKMAKSFDRAPAGSVLGLDSSGGLLATTPAADRDLPALTVLDDERRRRRLLRRLLGDRHGLRNASLETLRHKPQRRWVGLLHPSRGAAAVLRAYRPGRFAAAMNAVTAVGGADARTPALLGIDRRLGVAALEFVRGGHPRDGGDFSSAGSVLARLHARTGVVLRPDASTSEARAVRTAARHLGVLLPDLRDEVSALARTLSERLSALDDVRQPVHGDFSSDQVVIADDGSAALIDLDSARLGDPAVDLGCAAASLAVDVVVGTISEATRVEWLDALYDGYVTVGVLPDPCRRGTHEAAHLLRRAVEPFRLRLTPDWPEATRELVERAHRAIPTSPVSGGVR